MPTKTACAVGGNAHPSGTVVTALGKVVVVVVVVVPAVSAHGATGTTEAPGIATIVVVALHKMSGAMVGLADGSDDVDDVVVAALDMIGAAKITKSAAITALRDKVRRIHDTLVIKPLPYWSILRRYLSYGF